MTELEVIAADVTKLDVDAIANAANTQLRHGGGVAGAISRAGGPAVQRESDERAPIGLGEAVETTAGEYESADRHLAEAREVFRRGGDRWGLAAALWRTADLAFARGRLDDAQAALEEARAVLGPTQRERWIAHTLVGLAEVAVLRDDPDAAKAHLLDAHERYAARDDEICVADVNDRFERLLSNR